MLEASGECCHNGDMATIQKDRELAQPTDADSGFGGLAGRLNWLRAGVLGANDGIVSTAALVLGVAGATASRTSILLAGIVGLLAGAMSMAVGEYVSVSTQRDSERAVLTRERHLIEREPDLQLEALATAFEAKGIDTATAESVARQLTAVDALSAHAQTRFGIDPDDLTNPWHAAVASFLAFGAGALIPILGIAAGSRTWVTVIVVTVALALTGWVSARLGGAPLRRAIARNIGGGLVAMAVTYGLGALVGLAL